MIYAVRATATTARRGSGKTGEKDQRIAARAVREGRINCASGPTRTTRNTKYPLSSCTGDVIYSVFDVRATIYIYDTCV